MIMVYEIAWFSFFFYCYATLDSFLVTLNLFVTLLARSLVIITIISLFSYVCILLNINKYSIRATEKKN